MYASKYKTSIEIMIISYIQCSVLVRHETGRKEWVALYNGVVLFILHHYNVCTWGASSNIIMHIIM